MESLFTVQVPSSPNQSDGAPGIGTATTMQFSVAGFVFGIRFYATTTVGGTYTGLLYEVTSDDGAPAGTLLASASEAAASVVPGGFNDLLFATPQAVVTGKLYRHVIHNTDGRYVATPNFFSAAGLTNGHITAYQDATDPIGIGVMRQGTFIINAAPAYPTQGGNGTSYFADTLFDTVLPGSGAHHHAHRPNRSAIPMMVLAS